MPKRKHYQIAPGATPAEQLEELRRWVSDTKREIDGLCANPAINREVRNRTIAILQRDIGTWQAEIARLEASVRAERLADLERWIARAEEDQRHYLRVKPRCSEHQLADVDRILCDLRSDLATWRPERDRLKGGGA